jgi:plasmid stabilization system protein ParE
VIRLRFLRAAQVEYQAAVDHYEASESGLGQRFRDEVHEALSRVREFPAAFARLRESPTDIEMRALLLASFPIKVVYSVGDNGVVVVAVFHARRKPGYWLDRVRH